MSPRLTLFLAWLTGHVLSLACLAILVAAFFCLLGCKSRPPAPRTAMPTPRWDCDGWQREPRRLPQALSPSKCCDPLTFTIVGEDGKSHVIDVATLRELTTL